MKLKYIISIMLSVVFLSQFNPTLAQECASLKVDYGQPITSPDLSIWYFDCHNRSTTISSNLPIDVHNAAIDTPIVIGLKGNIFSWTEIDGREPITHSGQNIIECNGSAPRWCKRKE